MFAMSWFQTIVKNCSFYLGQLILFILRHLKEKRIMNKQESRKKNNEPRVVKIGVKINVSHSPYNGNQ